MSEGGEGGEIECRSKGGREVKGRVRGGVRERTHFDYNKERDGYHACRCSLVLRPCPAFHHLQYGKLQATENCKQQKGRQGLRTRLCRCTTAWFMSLLVVPQTMKLLQKASDARDVRMVCACSSLIPRLSWYWNVAVS